MEQWGRGSFELTVFGGNLEFQEDSEIWVEKVQGTGLSLAIGFY